MLQSVAFHKSFLNYLTDHSEAELLYGSFFTLCYCLFCVLQPCGHLLGKGWPLGSSVCDVFLCICHFPIQCPGSGVVLNCISS